MNPRNWSAKAQAIACLVVPALVAAANAYFGWHVDPNVILGFLGLGASGALAVAHIDNGETDPVPIPTAPDRTIVCIDAATAAKAKAILTAAGFTVA